jgi:hypothetical protein
MADTVDGVIDAVDAGIACGLAGVEGGLNPIADAGCAVAAGNMLGHEQQDDPVADPPPKLDLPADPEETTIRSSSTSQDDPPPAPPR